jgi:hypothetical protein
MPTKTFWAIVLSAASILPCGQIRAQDAAAAEAFLRNVYRHYQNGGEGIAFDGSRSSQYFYSSLLDMERADLKATGPGYAPAIDWDPICGCQDWDGIWNLDIEIRVKSPERIMANVSFALSDPRNKPTGATRRLQITLATEGGNWRIYDILDRSDPKFSSSVRQLLQKDLADLRSRRKPASN